MSYPYEFAITFRNRPSLTLNAKLYDGAGVQVGATITSGFVEHGNGAYSYLASLPDGHVGTFLVFDSAEPTRCFLWAINPREMENADVKTSTRSTFAGGAVASVTSGVTVTTNNDKTGYALSSAGVQAIWDALTSALTTVGSVGKLIKDYLDAAVSSRLATSGYTTPPTVTAIRAEMDSNSTKLANLDTTISSRAPSSTALSTTQWTNGRAANLDNLDAAVSTRLPTASYTAPPSTSAIVSAIMAYSVETGKDYDAVLKQLYAVLRGKAVANASDPTQIDYYAPDGTTVRVTHTLTDTTRTPS